MKCAMNNRPSMRAAVGAGVMAWVLACMLALPLASFASEPDLDYQRLSASLDHLATDPVLGTLARSEQARARDTLERLRQAGKKQRPHWVYLADRRVDLAYATARLEHAQYQLDQLQREHAAILLEASRQDAERTRHALELQRVQALAATEAAQRMKEQGQTYSAQAEQARAEAEQARALAQARGREAELSRKEAKLASAAAMALRASLNQARPVAGPQGMQMTIGDSAFASGSSTLRAEAREHLGNLVRFVGSEPAKSILIEGFTDSTGAAATNQQLSLARAESVRDALVAAGVDAARITAKGLGEVQPVATNDSAAGRASNRRVVVILKN